jgi:hypothetical protein
MTDLNNEQQIVGSPPVDSEVPITKFSAWYGFGEIGDASRDTFQIRIFIFDARKNTDGSDFRNELYILKDSLYPKLPDAFQFPNGVIRFFAYESQLASILFLLGSSRQLWLKTRSGRVSVISNEMIIS